MGRQHPEPAEHDHSGFESPEDYQDPHGRPVDYPLLDRLIGAGFDGCISCQGALLALITEDPVTTARLVELACVGVQQALGGLPPAMLGEHQHPGGPGTVFRSLARIGANGGNARMFARCATITAEQRRQAVDDALNLIVGQLASGFGM